jgi:putative transposase
MKENLINARTCVYNINYHVVWSVKYRRKVITEEMEQTMHQWALEIGEEKGFTVHLFEAGEKRIVESFLLCGDDRKCFGGEHPQIYRETDQIVLDV